jgi:hypothetical protein
MATSILEMAIAAARRYRRAILKVLSANDCGATGGHQSGSYLPKHAWRFFAPFPPEGGRLDKSYVRITWQGGERVTDSCVTWYGKETRSEYRLTRFGHNFPYLQADRVGDLLVIVPVDLTHFLAFVFESAEEIADIKAALGVETFGSWAIYEGDSTAESIETEDDCLSARWRSFVSELANFPTGDELSKRTLDGILQCSSSFTGASSDQRLLELLRREYELYRMVESRLCSSAIAKPFNSIDDFLTTASSIMNRRKSRAGRSMENHVAYLLREARIPHEVRPSIDGLPDIIIPSKAAYDNPRYPTSHLFMLGVKTTCKDRWRQVTREAPRIEIKHLITIQEGVSEAQMAEMRRHQVALVVPKKLHAQYPAATRRQLLDIEGFIETVRSTLV